jgi:hypothetical protein
MGLQAKVRPVENGVKEGIRRTPPPAVLLRYLEIRGAAVVSTIEVIDFRDAALFRSIAEILEQVPVKPLLFDAKLTACTTKFAGASEMIFGFDKIGKDILPAPADVPRVTLAIVIGALASHIDHAIDR